MPILPKYADNDGGLGLALSSLVTATRVTVENSTEYALKLVKEKRYDEALIFLNNAIEGIEILCS